MIVIVHGVLRLSCRAEGAKKIRPHPSPAGPRKSSILCALLQVSERKRPQRPANAGRGSGRRNCKRESRHECKLLERLANRQVLIALRLRDTKESFGESHVYFAKSAQRSSRIAGRHHGSTLARTSSL